MNEEILKVAIPPHSVTSTTVEVYLKNNTRRYTYQCNHPIKVGDWVNVKLPSGVIMTVRVEVVHDDPQLSDKWETKWCVLVETAEEYAARTEQSSELGGILGL